MASPEGAKPSRKKIRREKQPMRRAVWILVCLLFIDVSIQSRSQTTPTLEELKALRSIRGKIPGYIVWSTLRHGTWQIYKMKADGTGKIRLTKDQEENHQPVWSKNGEWIYFQRNNDIYRMRSDGSNSQIVVKDGFSFDISEDGLKLIYVTKEENKDSIVIRDLEKGMTEEIIPQRAPVFKSKILRYPTVSPDGQWLAFASDYPNPWTIHMAKLDGDINYQFANGCMPQYRPDGLMVAWITSGNHEVYIGAPDGKNKRPFERSIPGRPHCYFPKWSNDGEYIVFAASPHHDRTTSDYEIYIKSVKGGKAVRLTFHPGSDTWPDLFIPVKKRKAIR